MKKIIAVATVLLSMSAFGNNFFNPSLPPNAGVLPSFDNTQGSNNVPANAAQLPSFGNNNNAGNINMNIGIYDPVDEAILTTGQKVELRRIQFSIRDKENQIYRYLTSRTPDWRRIDSLYREIGALQASLASKYLRIKYEYVNRNTPKL